MNVMLFGCGLWGRNILRDLLRLDCIVTVIEPDPVNRRHAKRCGAHHAESAFTTSMDADGAVISTPASTHLDTIRTAQQLGVPIFVEKPLVTLYSDSVELGRGCPVPLFVMHTWRYHAGVECLKQVVNGGEIGRVESFRSSRLNWTSPRIDVDPVWTLLPHDISIAMEILGTTPVPVSASAEIHKGKPVGMNCTLEAGSVRLFAEVSSRYPDKRRELRLHGEAGVAVMPDDIGGIVEITRDSTGNMQPEIRTWPTEPGALYRELQTFLRYLNGGSPPKCDLQTGLAIVDVVLDLRRLAGIEQE